MWVYKTVLPLSISAFVVLGYFFIPIRPKLLSDSGLIGSLMDTLVLLPGFFIAALAAVSTFQRPEMDIVMPEPCPIIEIRVNDEYLPFDVTRRMFLSYLFSYLTILTFLIVLCGEITIALSPSIAVMLSSLIQASQHADVIILLGKLLTLGVFTFWSASVFVTMLHGIYFMSEKMHQPN